MAKKENEFLREFIEIYKSFPCLWRVKSQEYSDRAAKSRAYDVLIKKLKTIDKQADRESVVKKINSIRTCYRKELKKVIESERSSEHAEEIYVPRLWYYELLSFLQDQEFPRNSKCNIEEIQLPVTAILSSEPESTDVSLPSTPSFSASETYFKSHKTLKKRKSKCDDALIDKRLKRPTATVADKFTDIGHVWASKLRDLSPQQAIHAEKIINDVFYEAQLGNLGKRYCALQIQLSENHQTSFSAIPNIYSNFNAQHPIHSQTSFNTQPKRPPQPSRHYPETDQNEEQEMAES